MEDIGRRPAGVFANRHAFGSSTCIMQQLTKPQGGIAKEHERATWRAIQAAFADKWDCDLLDLIDDQYSAILAAMFTPAEV